MKEENSFLIEGLSRNISLFEMRNLFDTVN